MSEMPADTQSGMIKWFERCGFKTNPLTKLCRSARGAARVPSRDRGRSAPRSTTTSTASSTRSTGSTGRSGSASSRASPRWAIAHKFPAERATTVLQGHRDPGRPHRRADAGRQARAGRRRRRRRAERDAAQRGRDQGHRRRRRAAARGPRHPHRRHRDHPARRRRHPAGRRRACSTSGRRTPSPIKFPDEMPVLRCTPTSCARPPRRGEEGARARCTGEFACPYQKIEHLKHFVVAPRLRHRGPGREADRVVLREGLGEGAGRHLHAARRATRRSSSRSSKATAKPRCAICSRAISARREISLDRFIYALGIRHVGETTALALARGYGSWKAFHDACAQGRQGRRGGRRRDGCARPDRRHRDRGASQAYFGESHNRGIVERLTKQVTHPRRREAASRLRGRRQDRGVHRLAGKDDARGGEGAGRAARRQGLGLGVEEDRLRRRRPRRRLQARRGARSSASRC